VVSGNISAFKQSHLSGQYRCGCRAGKVLRATAKAGARKSGLCIVSAWVAEHELVLGERKVEEKSNEKTAIPLLLKSLALEGALVSSDAAGCQLTNADLIVERGGDYLIALKKKP
jgi:hypothetical protein